VDELHVSLSLAGRANAQTKYDILYGNVYAADICAAQHLPQICKRFTNSNNSSNSSGNNISEERKPRETMGNLRIQISNKFEPHHFTISFL